MPPHLGFQKQTSNPILNPNGKRKKESISSVLEKLKSSVGSPNPSTMCAPIMNNMNARKMPAVIRAIQRMINVVFMVCGGWLYSLKDCWKIHGSAPSCNLSEVHGFMVDGKECHDVDQAGHVVIESPFEWRDHVLIARRSHPFLG